MWASSWIGQALAWYGTQWRRQPGRHTAVLLCFAMAAHACVALRAQLILPIYALTAVLAIVAASEQGSWARVRDGSRIIRCWRERRRHE